MWSLLFCVGDDRSSNKNDLTSGAGSLTSDMNDSTFKLFAGDSSYIGRQNDLTFLLVASDLTSDNRTI